MKNINKRFQTKASLGEDRDEVVEQLIAGRDSLLEATDAFIRGYKLLKLISQEDAAALKNNVIDIILSTEGDLSLTNEVDRLQQSLQMKGYSYNEVEESSRFSKFRK